MTQNDWKSILNVPSEKSLVLVQSVPVDTYNINNISIVRNKFQDIFESSYLSEEVKAKISTLFHSKLYIAFLPTVCVDNKSKMLYTSSQAVVELSLQLAKVVGSNAVLMLTGSDDHNNDNDTSSTTNITAVDMLKEYGSVGLIQKLVVSEVNNGNASKPKCISDVTKVVDGFLGVQIDDQSTTTTTAVIEGVVREYDKMHTRSETHSVDGTSNTVDTLKSTSRKLDPSLLFEFEIPEGSDGDDENSIRTSINHQTTTNRKRIFSYKLWTYRAVSV